jgi:hypothetical protein
MVKPGKSGVNVIAGANRARGPRFGQPLVQTHVFQANTEVALMTPFIFSVGEGFL